MLKSLPTNGLPPWANQTSSFASWIPTILGHLSFSMMALKSSWLVSEGVNLYSKTLHGRIVATHKERVAQDFPYSDFFVRLRAPQSVQHYFLLAKTCQAQIPFVEGEKVRPLTDEQGALVGEIIVAPSDKVSRRKEFIKKLVECIENREQESEQFLERLSDHISQANQQRVFLFRLDFCLFRTGEVRFWFCPDKQSPGFDKLNSTDLEKVAKQAYYFLKDIAHTHYHHEPDSDQLIECARLSRPTQLADHASNEIAWKREVLWGFARVIAQLRRNNDLRSLKRVQGILAYADAFQSNVAIVRRSLNLDGHFSIDRDLTIYDFAHAKASISALDNFRAWYNTGSFQLLASILALFLSVLSLWAAVTRIGVSDCEAGLPCVVSLTTFQLQVIGFFAMHPLRVAGLFLFPTMLLYLIFIRDVKAFRITKRYDRFIRIGFSAIGAQFAASSGNNYLGFLLSSSIYVMIIVAELLVLAMITFWIS